MLLTQLPDYFKERRDSLMQSHPGAVFLIPAAPELTRNSDVLHPYRQDSNFYYLTGLNEPQSFLVLSPANSKPGDYQTTLFVLPRDPEKEMWDGELYGLEGAQSIFAADEAYSIHELETRLPTLFHGADRVFYRIYQNPEMDRRVLGSLESFRRSVGRNGRSLLPIEDLNQILGEQRLFKSKFEIAHLRKASEISSKAHREAMKQTRPGMKESEIEALVDYVIRREGCQRVGYGSIVAGGKNATCLHYHSNNDILKDGTLLLIDAGGEYDYYTADITRTFPVGERFTRAQATAYDLVLKAQKSAISMTKPGVKIPEIHRHICEILVDGLLSLGLMQGKADEILKSGGYRRFYPHSTSHWLGMDVHDVGLYTKNGEPRQLEAGMVFTIEPGFYVQPNDTEVPDEYKNIGIRIEDDIYVTSNGCEILTRDAPKERAEIESLRS